MAQAEAFDFPPIYGELATVFPIHERRDVIFSFGPWLYNPYMLHLLPQILAHEAAHGQRQGTDEQGILDWWRRYMEDTQFRLIEESWAHRAEYCWLRENGSKRQRRRAKKQVAAKLAGPLLGNMVNLRQARQILMLAPTMVWLND